LVSTDFTEKEAGSEPEKAETSRRRASERRAMADRPSARPSNYYTFECYNTGKRYLQVTEGYVKSGRID